jgi:hypothetical protein
MVKKTNAYRLLEVKSGGRRPIVRSLRRWVDKMKLVLAGIGCRGVDWISVAKDRDK